MEVVNSILVLDDFSIMRSSIGHTPIDKGNLSFKEIQNRYPLNIDFDVYHNSEYTSHLIRIFLYQNIDCKPGYNINVEAAGIFSFSEELDKDQKREFILNSALGMCITNLRSFVANTTSYYLFGRYDFPAIDVSDLLNQKMTLELQKKEEKGQQKNKRKIKQSNKKASM